jgi:hypothetical protein
MVQGPQLRKQPRRVTPGVVGCAVGPCGGRGCEGTRVRQRPGSPATRWRPSWQGRQALAGAGCGAGADAACLPAPAPFLFRCSGAARARGGARARPARLAAAHTRHGRQGRRAARGCVRGAGSGVGCAAPRVLRCPGFRCSPVGPCTPYPMLLVRARATMRSTGGAAALRDHQVAGRLTAALGVCSQAWRLARSSGATCGSRCSSTPTSAATPRRMRCAAPSRFSAPSRAPHSSPGMPSILVPRPCEAWARRAACCWKDR